MKTEDQIADLQSQFAHQEVTIQQLSDALYDQQCRIDDLERELNYVRNELKKRQSSASNAVDDGTPPHY